MERRRISPPVQPLLLRHIWTLCWVGGLLASRWCWPSLTALAILPLVDSRLHTLPRLCVFSICILAGWTTGTLLQPVVPKVPVFSGTPLLEGRVHQVQGLPGNRLRIFLEQVNILDDGRLSSTAPSAQHLPSPSPERTGSGDAASLAPRASAPDASVSFPRTLPGMTVWNWDDPLFRPLPGQHLQIRLRPRDIQGSRNPGISDMEETWKNLGVFQRLWSKGDKGSPNILGAANADAAWRERLRSRLIATLGQGQELTQAQAFLPALLFGDKSGLSLQTVEWMTQATLVHSLALSGQHLGLAVSCAALLAWLCNLLWPRSFLLLPRPRLIALLSLPPALLYLWLGDTPPSLLRAFFMLLFFAIYLWNNKPRLLCDLLLDAVLIITIVSPRMVFDTGFQLSVLSIATIALSLPALRQYRPPADPTKRKTRRFSLFTLLMTIIISAALTVTLLPITLLTFHTASPWFFFNLVWLPILACWVLPAAALGLTSLALGGDSLAMYLLQAATFPCQLLLDLLAYCDGIGLLHVPLLPRPHWTVLPGMAALLTGLSLWPGRPRLPASGKKLLALGSLLIVASLLLPLQHHFSRDIHLSLLDVGQGQAIMLELPGSVRMLLDGGGSLSPRFDTGRHIVAPVLCYHHLPRLQYVINSHPHLDHLRGLLFILEHFHVGEFWYNGELPPGYDGQRLQALLNTVPSRILRAGDVIPLTTDASPALRLEVLWPPDATEHDNNASLCLRLVWGERGLALLPGDMEQDALRRLVQSGRKLQAEILVAPHHGSQHSALPAFYDAVQPSLVLVSCGHNNRYGNPSRQLLRFLQKRHIPLLSTADNGCISVRWNMDKPHDRLSVSTMRP